MKTTFTILALMFTAFVLPSYAEPTDAATQTPRVEPVLHFGQLTIPFPTTGTLEVVSCDGVTYDSKAGVVSYLGQTKLVVTSPGQKPVTISGEDLTIKMRK